MSEGNSPQGWEIRDSGQRQEFAGGMIRDTCEGKIDYTGLLFGPLLKRWAAHTTAGRAKYPDVQLGVPNWTLAAGEAEYHRFRQSAFRHFMQYMAGETDEDHLAATAFNLNGMEYVREKLAEGGKL